MPRDNDRTGDRPSGKRGPPSRGKGPPRGGKGPPRGDKPRLRDGERPARSFRSDRRDGPAPDKREPRAGGGKSFGGKSFGAKRDGGKSFGDKRPYAAKSPGFRKDGDRAEGARPARKPFDRDAPRGPARDRGSDRPQSNFKRDDARPRSNFKRDDAGGRPERSPRQDFRGKDSHDRAPRKDFHSGPDRTGEKPWQSRSSAPSGDAKRIYTPRSDAGRDDRRPPRDGARSFDKPRFNKSASDRPRSDRPYGDRPRSDRPQSDRPRPERSRDDRPSRSAEGDRGPRKFDRPRGDRPFAGKSHSDRPRSDRPKFDRPRDDRPREDRPRNDRPRSADRGGERPRFNRDRDDGPATERPRNDRPRQDLPPRSRHVWREPVVSETGDDRFAGEQHDAERTFPKRPAFGGRGAYRERKPEPASTARKRGPAALPPGADKVGERIAKVVARAGMCSRRDAEAWIVEGRIAVNGRVINSPALDVTSRDVITIDGAPLPERERTRLFLYHKPRGLVTTHADPEGRATVFDNLPEHLPRVISIGRLDFNTEGLLLLTNDGGLARTLELPDTGWLRRYRVRAHGSITQARLDELRDGIEVEGVKYGSIEAILERDLGANVWIVFAIREGKNREVRNVLGHLGLEVNRLIRISYGPFQLGELEEGQVEEVRSRVLRDQLGEKIASAAHADFQVPVQDDGTSEDDAAPAPAKRVERPRSRAVIADRKGRRVLVERSGGSERDDSAPRRPPGTGYKGKRDKKPRDK